MRRVLLIFLLIPSFCFAQNSVGPIASSKVRQSFTPLQFNFGPFTPVSPYTNGPQYSLVPFSQMQPSGVIWDNNQFSSTGSFTTIEKTDASATFSVAANQGTITTTSASGQTYTLGSSSSYLKAPDGLVCVEIDQNGSTSSTDLFGVGFFTTDANIDLEAQFNGNNFALTACNSGTCTDYNHTTITVPSAPWEYCMGLQNSTLSNWYSTDGVNLHFISSADVSARYDPRVNSLTLFQAGITLYTSVATTWKMSNLKTSLPGGIGTTDAWPVITPDHRPYMVGSVAYLTMSIDMPGSNSWGIFKYDFSSSTLTFLDTLAIARGTGIYADTDGVIIYDPPTNTERVFVSTWGDSSGKIVYAAQSISTDDWLSGASVTHVTPTATVMSLPGISTQYDPDAACVYYNFSALTCGKWLVAYAGASSGNAQYATATSASDPSANSWTAALSQTARYEGSKIIRTPTVYAGAGVNYDSCFTGIVPGGSGAEVRKVLCYNAANALDGSIKAPLPAGASNPPHLALIPYNGTEYAFSSQWFTQFPSTTSNNWGDVSLSSSTAFPGGTNWPTLTREGSTFSSSSSVSSVTVSTGADGSSFSLNSGDLVIAVLRGSNSATSTASITDSLGDSFTCGSINTLSATGPSASGFDFGCYSFVTHSGAVTFTGSMGTSQPYSGLTVEQFSPGFLTSQDNAITYSNILTGSTASKYTSSAFSTSAKGLVVVCPDLLAGGGTFQPGFIGPYMSAFGAGLASGAAPCEGTLTTGAQTGITASLATGNTTVGWWGGTIFTFK